MLSVGPREVTRVRVLMPCFDDEPAHLDEALASLRSQTLIGWELVIVDDGSTRPETLRHLNMLAEANPDVTVLHQGNAGPAAARNRAAHGATAPYLLALDSDDRISANFLECTLDVLETNQDVAAAYGTTIRFGAENGTSTDDDYSWQGLLVQNMIPVTALVRRAEFEAVGGFDVRMRDGLEDHEFFLNLLSTTGKGARKVPEAALFYRIRPRSRNASAHGDLEKLYRARGYLMAKHGRLYLDHPELVYASELTFRAECLRWRARYGPVEKVKALTRLDRFAATIK